MTEALATSDEDEGYFGEDEDNWNIDSSGKIGISLFGKAIQVWSVMQDRTEVTVAEAAAAFKCEPQMVVEAVEDHPWMLLEGPDDDFTKLRIEHEGE